MGPSVKFVSAIKDAIFNKKNGGKFFFVEKMPNWGGVRGEFGKRPHFFRFFFRTLPLGQKVGQLKIRFSEQIDTFLEIHIFTSGVGGKIDVVRRKKMPQISQFLKIKTCGLYCLLGKLLPFK